MKSLDELKQLVDDVDSGKVFMEVSIPSPELTNFVFLPLNFIRNKELLKSVFMVYEYVDKSTESIMGLPVFNTMQWLTKEETELLVQIASEKNGIDYKKIAKENK